MPALDVFAGDSFNMVSLTTAMNKLPYKPARLGEMKLFEKSGMVTTTALIEEQNGRLILVPNQARGVLGNVIGGTVRKARAFNVTNLPLSGEVMADDVQNIRAFGSETEIQALSDLVNDKLQTMRQSIEYTHEWHRIGAIKGKLLDADGSTQIYDWFAEFGITPATDALDFTANTSSAVKKLASRIIRVIQDNLGMAMYDHIHVMCGSTLFDNIVNAAETKNAYDRWQNGQMLRDSQVRQEFEYAGVVWEEYRGRYITSAGAGTATPFIPVAEGYAFVVGASDVFAEKYAPAPFAETVNTKGKAVYVKQQPKDFNLGVDLLAISCPLIYCSRPSSLVKITGTTGTPV